LDIVEHSRHRDREREKEATLAVLKRQDT